MKYLTLVAAFLFCTAYTQAQTYEIGAFLGGSNYVGDIGPTIYVNPNSVAAGFVFKWNRSKRHAFRFSLMYTDLKSDDANAYVGKRIQRGYSFENNLTEASLGIEYAFWEWDLHSYKPQIVPYLYTGLTLYHANSLRRENGVLEKVGETWNFSIPLVLGVKGTLSNHLVLAFEVGPRYTFSDNLDGSNPVEIYENTGANPNTNDWYVFSGLTLTYTFGRKPCYCNF